MKRFLIFSFFMLFLACALGEGTMSKEEGKIDVKKVVKEIAIASAKQDLNTKLVQSSLPKPFTKQTISILKKELEDSKLKIAHLNKKLGLATPQTKMVLKKEKKVIKTKCQTIRHQMQEIEANLKALKRAHKDECVKKATAEAQKAKAIIVKLKPKLIRIKERLKTLKATIKVAPIHSKPHLAKRIAKLAKKYAAIKVKAKEEKVKYTKAVKVIQVIKEKKIITFVKETGAKLTKVKSKIAKTKAKKLAIKLQIKQLLNEKKMTEDLVKINKIKVVIEKKKAKIVKYTNKVKMLTLEKKELKKEFTKASKELHILKKVTRFTQLTKKLTKELTLSKVLKKKFEAKAKLAAETKKKKDVKKALLLKKRMQAATNFIAKIKRKMRGLSKSKSKKAQGKLKKLKKILIKKKEELKFYQTKFGVITEKCKKAMGEEALRFEAKKAHLYEKIQKISMEIMDFEKKKVLVKVSLAGNCKERLAKEKKLSAKLIKDNQKKLDLAKKEERKLSEALALSNKISALVDKAHKLKIEGLATQEVDSVREIAIKRGEILAKINEYKSIAEIHKQKAASLRKMIETRTSVELGKAKKDAAKQEAKYEGKIKMSIKKSKALEIAMRQATDEAVREALKAQAQIEAAKLAKYQAKVKSASQSIYAVELEISLKKKALEDLKKEAALQAILLEKKFQQKMAKLKIEFDIKKKSTIIGRKHKLTAEEELKIKKLKQRIQIIENEFTEFKITLRKEHTQKTKVLLDGQTDKFKASIKLLIAQLKKAKKDYEDYKKQFKIDSERKLTLIEKASLKSLKIKIQELEAVIAAEVAKNKAKLDAARRLFKEKILAKKRETREKIEKLEGQITKIIKASANKEATLKKKMAVEVSKGEETKDAIKAERLKHLDITKKLQQWEDQEEKNLKSALDIKQKITKKMVEKLDASIAKIKTESIRKKTELNAKLKSASNEIVNLKKAILNEKNLYRRLVMKFGSSRLSAKQKRLEHMKNERERRIGLEISMKKKMVDCDAKVFAGRNKINDLNAQLDIALEQLRAEADRQKRMSESRVMVTEYTTQLSKLETDLKQNKADYADLCTGDDCQTPICMRMQSRLADTEVKMMSIKSKIKEEEARSTGA